MGGRHSHVAVTPGHFHVAAAERVQAVDTSRFFQVLFRRHGVASVCLSCVPRGGWPLRLAVVHQSPLRRSWVCARPGTARSARRDPSRGAIRSRAHGTALRKRLHALVESRSGSAQFSSGTGGPRVGSCLRCPGPGRAGPRRGGPSTGCRWCSIRSPSVSPSLRLSDLATELAASRGTTSTGVALVWHSGMRVARTSSGKGRLWISAEGWAGVAFWSSP